MELVNLDNGRVLASRIQIASSFHTRLIGLMFTRSLAQDSGLHIRPCRSVHTFFMRYTIDVVHLDRDNRIVGLERRMTPGRIGTAFKGTASVVELPAGTLDDTQTQVGQSVAFTDH